MSDTGISKARLLELRGRDVRVDLLVDVHEVRKRELTMDANWRIAVRKRLAELGLLQRDLAAWIGTSQSQISGMLGDKPFQRSYFVERVSIALRIPLPDPARIEVAVAALLEDGHEDRLAVLVASAELFAKQ